MNVNPDKDFQKKFTGNIIFYRESKCRRPPIFLQRNIRKFLLFHGLKSYKWPPAPHATKNMGSSKEADMVLKPSPPPKWSIKEVQARLAMNVPHEPVLRINVVEIKDRKAGLRHSHLGYEPPPKRLKSTHVQAKCLLTIWARDSANQADPVYLVKQSKPCIIQAATKDSGERTATISLESPFFVTHGHFNTDELESASPSGARQIYMQLLLVADNPTDLWPPFNLSSPQPAISQKMENGALVRFPMLLGRWLRLPRLPESPSESLLDICAFQDGRRYKTNLGLVIDAAWSTHVSPLTLHNRLVCKPSSANRRLPSQTSEQEPNSKISVRWIFQGSWDSIENLEFEGYFCPLCNRHPFSSADVYHFHLITSHDLFNFEMSVNANVIGKHQQRISVEVYISLADTFREKAGSHVKDDREMEWLRPPVPFNLQAFLKGDSAWPGNETKRHNNLAGAGRPRLGVSGSDTPKADRFIKRRKAGEIPDVPHPDRRKFRVPPAPEGIRFFKLTVKRPLNEGEWVSESDDEIDEGWLFQRHNETIRRFTDILPSEKKFILRYDRHMLEENLSSNLHFREALIRFCRRNREWLQQRDMKIEFHKNCARLIMEGYISPKLVQDCVDIIGRMGRGEVGVKKEGTGINSQITNTTISALDDYGATRRRYGGCRCGSNIFTLSDVIRCSNLDCKAPDYHLQCIGLSNRPTLWLCPACNNQSSLLHNTAPVCTSPELALKATEDITECYMNPNGPTVQNQLDPRLWSEQPDAMPWRGQAPPPKWDYSEDVDSEYEVDEGYPDSVYNNSDSMVIDDSIIPGGSDDSFGVEKGRFYSPSDLSSDE